MSQSTPSPRVPPHRYPNSIARDDPLSPCHASVRLHAAPSLPPSHRLPQGAAVPPPPAKDFQFAVPAPLKPGVKPVAKAPAVKPPAASAPTPSADVRCVVLTGFPAQATEEEILDFAVDVKVCAPARGLRAGVRGRRVRGAGPGRSARVRGPRAPAPPMTPCPMRAHGAWGARGLGTRQWWAVGQTFYDHPPPALLLTIFLGGGAPPPPLDPSTPLQHPHNNFLPGLRAVHNFSLTPSASISPHQKNFLSASKNSAPPGGGGGLDPPWTHSPHPPLSTEPYPPQIHDARGRGSSKTGTSSRWHHERAPHLPRFSNPPPSPPPPKG